MILKVQTGDIIGLFSSEMLIRLENGVIIQFQILYDPISRKITSTQLSNEHIFGLCPYAGIHCGRPHSTSNSIPDKIRNATVRFSR